MRAFGDNPGFGPAANQAMKLVEGAGFFCFLHDDVALAPSSISELVAETYRSNAGVVGPKLVDWDRPNVLQHVGLSADRIGVTLDTAEIGELDQEQHDAVRDVFCLPTACLLVRIDLFRALGGFAPDIDYFGDDLDLCWRRPPVGRPGARGARRPGPPSGAPSRTATRPRCAGAVRAPPPAHLAVGAERLPSRGSHGVPLHLHGGWGRCRAAERSGTAGAGDDRRRVLAARPAAGLLHPASPLPGHAAGLRRRGGQPPGSAGLRPPAGSSAASAPPIGRAEETVSPSSAAICASSSAGRTRASTWWYGCWRCSCWWWAAVSSS